MQKQHCWGPRAGIIGGSGETEKLATFPRGAGLETRGKGMERGISVKPSSKLKTPVEARLVFCIGWSGQAPIA